MMDDEHDTLFSRTSDDEGATPVASDKIACHRCRLRKVKCDRGNPCHHCVKAGVQCSYAIGPKLRERRQRVMVSQNYDSKLDAISKKIDILTQRMGQLSHDATKDRDAKLPDPIDAVKVGHHDYGSPSFTPTPSLSSVYSAPIEATRSQRSISEVPCELSSNPVKAEYEGESSLLAHAVFASQFIQNAINETSDTQIAHEMQTVLLDFRAALVRGKQQSDTLDSFPRAKAVTQGSTRNLPLPPIDKVFTCLRMARDCPQVATLWLADYIKPAQFYEYLIKVASSGPATEAELIIVHCGLFWLFCECSKAVSCEMTKRDYDTQALTCEANLETVLYNLRFHQPTHLDFAYAMGMASLYCLQKSRASAAWNFITSASQTVQSLGLQHINPKSTEKLEDEDRKQNLFWTIYMTEKMLSLRLGRSSSLRDQDITLPRPGSTPPEGTFLVELAPGWISIANIQGRIYDEIYSPGALMKSANIRLSRAQALAAELRITMQNAQDVHDFYKANKGHVLGLEFHEIARRSDRVIGLSMLTLIYRSFMPEKSSKSAFCRECIGAARETLQEHERCVEAILRAKEKKIFLEAYVNWTITQSPFVPFIILFCHTIETSEDSDLKHMKALVDTFESSTNARGHRTCEKQYRLFKALYDVAAKFVETKAKRDNGQEWLMWSMAQQQQQQHQVGKPLHNSELNVPGMGVLMPGGAEQVPRVAKNQDIPGQMPLHGSGNSGMRFSSAWTESIGSQNTMLEDADVEMDPEGSRLWDWFNTNQAIMSTLENT